MLRQTLKEVLYPFLLSRALVFVVLLCGSLIQTVPSQGWERVESNVVINLSLSRAAAGLQKAFRSGDGHFYLQVAEQGYDRHTAVPPHMKNWVFFPLYPLAVRAVQVITRSYLLSALLVSNIAFFIGLLLLYQLVVKITLNSETASRAVWLLAFNPMSYIFSAPMTESLFLALLTGSFLLFSKAPRFPSALVMACCAVSRPTGVLVLPAYAAAVIKKEGLRRSIWPLCLATAGLLSFSAYMFQLTGEPLAFIHNQRYWDRSGSILTMLKAADPTLVMTGWNFTYLSALAMLAAAAAAVYYFSRHNYSFGLMLLVPCAALIATGTLISGYRVVMPLFPFWLIVSEILNSNARFQTALILSSSLLALLTLGYAMGVTAALV